MVLGKLLGLHCRLNWDEVPCSHRPAVICESHQYGWCPVHSIYPPSHVLHGPHPNSTTLGLSGSDDSVLPSSKVPEPQESRGSMSLPSPEDQQLGSGTLSDRHQVTSDEMRASSYSHLCSTASPQLPILYNIWSSLLGMSVQKAWVRILGPLR